MARRLEQLNELLQREIGTIIMRDVEFPYGAMATIVDIRTSGDLKQSVITVSIFPDAKRGSILEILKKNTRHIELLLQERLRMHHIPALSWSVDITETKAAEVEALLDSLHKEA